MLRIRNWISFLLFQSVVASPVFGASEAIILEAYVKVRSMKEMAPKVMEIAKESKVPMQQLAMPFFVLGIMGHPNYPSIQDGTVGWMIFRESSGNKQSFFIGKLVPNSNLEISIKALGWGIENYKGWTIIGKKASSIQAIQDKDYLIKLMQQPSKTGLEFFFSHKENAIVHSSDEKWMKFVRSLKTAQLNLDIHEKNISIMSTLHPRSGESLDLFLSKVSKVPFTQKNITNLDNQTSLSATIDKVDLPKVYESISKFIDIEKETQKL